MRIIGRAFRILFFTLALVVAGAAAAVIVMETAWFKNWLRDYIVREGNQYLNGQLSIGRLGGNLFSGVALEQVGVSMDGERVVSIESIRLNYDVFEMFSNGVSIARISLNRPVIALARRDDTWTIARLVKERNTDPNGKPRPIAINNIEITDGAVAISGQDTDGAVRLPHRFEHIDAKFAFTYRAPRFNIDIANVSFRAAEPTLALNALSGAISVDDAGVTLRKVALRTEESSLAIDGSFQRKPEPVVDIAVNSEKLTLAEIARVVPAVAGFPLQPAFEIKLSGPTDRLAITMNVRSTAGQVSGTLVAELGQPAQSVTGDIVLRDFNLAPFARNPELATNITGKASVAIHGKPLSDADSLRISLKLDTPHLAALGYAADAVTVNAQVAGPRITFNARALAYGAAATTVGRVTLAGEKRPLTYDLHGVARHVDLTRLPRQVNAPKIASDINAAYQVSGSVAPGNGKNRQSVTADGRFEASTLAGIRIAAGSTGGVTLKGPDIQYRADATLAALNLRRVGEAFDVTALKDQRFESEINGHVTASGSGTAVREMSLSACGTLTDSSLPGVHITDSVFDTTIAHDSLHVTASGNVDNVDLKTALQRPSLDGQIKGSLAAEATIANLSQGVTADQVEASARVDLHDSTLGKIAIDRAAFDGDYHHSNATIRTLDVKGPTGSAQAHGMVALDESGQSDLTFHADAPSLEEIGKLVDKPLAGIAIVDGTVTGNKRELIVSGHASGNGLKYDTSGALVLATDYTVHLPNLSVDDVSVTASTNATFVQVGGQNINALVVKTDYTAGQLAFDGTARQPNRTLGLAGAVTLKTDEQEVRLQRLEAATQGLAWQLAPGAEPVIRYAGNAIAVKDLRLRSGEQLVTADGTFGRPDDALDVTLDNVDLAAVDAVLLRPPQLSGRLHASAHVTGTRDQPQVKADFQITQGGFRQFRYADFSGSVNYGGKGVTVDAKLQQDPSAWLTAKGYVPLAVFNGPGNTPASGAAPLPEDSVNLQIESSPIQLGIIQGFTTAVTNVTGTLQANLQVTGTANDPHPGGSISIRNAAFSVAATGVTYSGGSGQVEFQGDRIHVDELRLADNQRKGVVVTGDLAFHELELGGVDISVKATDFKIIDNKIGNVRINSDLHIAGELRYPRIEGDLGLQTGTINLDELLASTTESAYSTTPIGAPAAETPAADTAPAAPAAPSPFDALSMDVHLTVPNDLVVKGSDLRVPDAPIGLGALTLTMGGDLWVSKTPWDRPRLTGSVNTVRGTYDFQGRRFDLLRDGTLRFDGLDESDPVLDIRAERLIQGVQTNVNIRGTLRHPDMVLTSVPPLPQSDILALIVFNQPASQLGEGQQVSLVQRAQSMALGALAGEVASSIGSALDLNTFEIQLAPDTGATAQITVGQQVGQNLFVKVEQGVGDQTTTNVVIEYQLGKWLLLQTNVREGASTLQPFQRVQGSGVDLIFFFSY